MFSELEDVSKVAEFSSVGGAPATCVEAVVLAAGDPGSNPALSGPILRVIAPLSLCLLFPVYLY